VDIFVYILEMRLLYSYYIVCLVLFMLSCGLLSSSESAASLWEDPYDWYAAEDSVDCESYHVGSSRWMCCFIAFSL